MKSKIEAAAKAPETMSVSKLPDLVQKISGKTYQFHPNQLGLISFSLSFGNGAETKLILTEDENYEENLIGLDGVYKL